MKRWTTRRPAPILILSLSLSLSLAVGACGSNDDAAVETALPAAADEQAEEQPDEPAVETAAEPAADSGSGFGGGSATVTIEGATYEFASAGGSTTVCKDIFGTFQVLLPYIDETGQPVDGPELNMIALQPGIENDDTRDSYVDVNLPTGDLWVAGESGLAEILDVETPPVTATADGMTFSATVTLTKLYDTATTADAVIEVTCS